MAVISEALFLFLVQSSIVSPCCLQEIQHKLESIQKELCDQRDRDGGVFISLERKDEMERKMAELEQLRKEFKDLSVSYRTRCF